MKKIIAIGSSSCIIAAIWTMVSFAVGLSTIAGFLAWSSFFAAGGRIKGLRIAILNNLSGVIWGTLMGKLSVLLMAHFNETISVTISNGIGSAMICLQSKIPLVLFIPGGFIGWSAYLASKMNFSIAVISMICGALLGFTSEKLTNLFLNINRAQNE